MRVRFRSVWWSVLEVARAKVRIGLGLGLEVGLKSGTGPNPNPNHISNPTLTFTLIKRLLTLTIA